MRRLALILLAAWGIAPGAVMAPPAAAQTADPAAGGGDAAAVPRTLASNGAIVPMPQIAGLDCPGMASVLGLIDQSRYRGPEPVPEGHPDRRIFEYEHRLAAAYYRSCIMSGHRLDDPGPAFGRGFEQP